jgi:acyl-coenzyme A synthetase/AMP-(fatty) acid ligase
LVEFRAELPYSETGKLLRRVLKAELATGTSTTGAEEKAVWSPRNERNPI